ncbi:MAG: sensor histidine kinase [Arenimonas sp.]
MKTTIFFFGRIILAWLLMFIATSIFFNMTGLDSLMDIVVFLFWVALILLLLAAASHLHHVQLIDGAVDLGKLKNRHRRQIEIPFEEEIALPMLEACVRELQGITDLKISQDRKRLQTRVIASDSDKRDDSLWKKAYQKLGFERHNHVVTTATTANGSVSVSLFCGPDGAAWADSFFLDEGTNLQNAETVTRAISRHIAEYRRGEQASTKETVTEKELAVAKLNLLHAQVEPHFLYNTLGSAKYLISSDPVSAEAMLDNLILYLRHSLPRSEDTASTLGEEVERTRAYLDILKIRMGERLQVNIEVPKALQDIPFPTMMLQTLVENSINHGLEPKSGGGNIWISARADQSATNLVTVTVADDGNGFGSSTSGTGIGLQNVRERLKLAYGGAASFSIMTNFPNGVAASISVPAEGPKSSP